jgi:thiol-disulfide isomerase/thioredoxin
VNMNMASNVFTSRVRAALLAPALLALFAAACQPAAKTEGAAVEAEAAAQAASASPLARFATGDLERLEFGEANLFPAEVKLQGADGVETDLSAYKGKVVVLNLWGEWCAPCVEEMPTLANLQKAFPREEVAVVPVAVGDADALASSAAKLKELAGEELPFFYDPDFAITEAVKSGAFPSTIVYGRDGVEAARLIYPAHWDSDRAQALIKAVLAGEG